MSETVTSSITSMDGEVIRIGEVWNMMKSSPHDRSNHLVHCRVLVTGFDKVSEEPQTCIVIVKKLDGSDPTPDALLRVGSLRFVKKGNRFGTSWFERADNQNPLSGTEKQIRDEFENPTPPKIGRRKKVVAAGE